MNTDKLIKVLELTRSPVDGEALNAIRIANQLLEKEKLTWAVVLTSSKVQAANWGKPVDSRTWSPTPPWTQGKPENPFKQDTRTALVEDMFDAVMNSVAGSSSEEFIESLYEQWEKRGTLSPKQMAALQKFYENIRD